MKVKIGRTAVSIARGDITEAEVDAIVNAANSELWMGAGVAGAIKRKGGTVIEEDAVRQGPIEVGEAVLTVAGNLNATHVIHAAAMGPELKATAENIAKATKASLAIADKHRLESIAFPALGTGVGAVPPADSAQAMLTTLVDHLREGKSSLQKVIFVLYQDETSKAFADTLKKLTGVQ
jgi:O-acetyl-ADP-ribose deacetylase (regulator of RNase III)